MIKKLLVIASVVMVFLSSCVTYNTYTITGNPIGTKTGVAKSKLFGSGDCTLKTAAANGKITKIGAVQITTRNLKIITKVYGE